MSYFVGTKPVVLVCCVCAELCLTGAEVESNMLNVNLAKLSMIWILSFYTYFTVFQVK